MVVVQGGEEAQAKPRVEGTGHTARHRGQASGKEGPSGLLGSQEPSSMLGSFLVAPVVSLLETTGDWAMWARVGGGPCHHDINLVIKTKTPSHVEREE